MKKFQDVQLNAPNEIVSFRYLGAYFIYHYSRSELSNFTYEYEGEEYYYDSMREVPKDALCDYLLTKRRLWQIDFIKQEQYYTMKHIITTKVSPTARFRVRVKERKNIVGIIENYYTVSIKLDSEIVKSSSFNEKKAVATCIDKANHILTSQHFV